MNAVFGHVQTNSEKRDAALLELYARLVDRNRPAPGSFSTLGEDERREYFRVARRRSRAVERKARDAGAPKDTVGNVRDALADAALMILAADAPGAEHVRHVLATVFAQRPGVPLAVENRARRGKLKPKFLAR